MTSKQTVMIVELLLQLKRLDVIFDHLMVMDSDWQQ